MAKKRGRPPKSHGPSEKASIDSQKIGLELSELDEEDLADIDSLSPKQAEKLMKNLDLIREKLKGKAPVSIPEKQSNDNRYVVHEEEDINRTANNPNFIQDEAGQTHTDQEAIVRTFEVYYKALLSGNNTG
ncbi:hypothetical protein RIF29_34470 [Crotalaria pallida]|uniref:Uncharacterized protein n=1 Tax=Crotalaria pallida TaxID=3830 RepID=A0AAN9EA57_CROPI